MEKKQKTQKQKTQKKTISILNSGRNLSINNKLGVITPEKDDHVHLALLNNDPQMQGSTMKTRWRRSPSLAGNEAHKTQSKYSQLKLF